MTVKAIEANETNFDVSVQALMDLKNAGVSQAVIEAMLSAEAKKRTAPASGTKNAEDAHQVAPVRSQTGAVGSGNARNEDPWPTEVSGMPREVGAYYKQPDGKFVELFGKPIVATSTGGFIKMGLTMGLSKIRSRGQLPGKHAQLQVTERDPVFYIYMPEDQTPGAVSIVRMEEKGDRREFEVGSIGGASGSSKSGNPSPCSQLHASISA